MHTLGEKKKQTGQFFPHLSSKTFFFFLPFSEYKTGYTSLISVLSFLLELNN